MPNIKKIDLNLLVVLDALLDEGNVTRAAARLGYTQPTISGMLARLRDLFGDPLFVRAQRGLLPTPRAKALAIPIKQARRQPAAGARNEFDQLRPRQLSPSRATTTCSSRFVPFVKVLRSEPNRSDWRLCRRSSRASATLSREQIDLAVTIPEFRCLICRPACLP
jgi:DNA-binding transcriptional LysR family regulator